MSSTGHAKLLEQLVCHIALPRKLPGKEDQNRHRFEEAISTRFLDAVVKLTRHVSPEHLHHVNGLRESLMACAVLNVDGTVGKIALLKEFQDLDGRKMLILYLESQNCALLIYADDSDSGERQVVFEAFETSASAEQVLASSNALQWDFPGSAVSVPHSTFSTSAFQEALVTFLEQASTERVSKFAAVTRKASTTIPEIRNTSDPALISGLLMTILEASGTIKSVPVLRKRVRDAVIFDNACKPWRRSAFYLVIRVAVQRYYYMHLGPDIGRLYYKITMCLLMAELLRVTHKGGYPGTTPETTHHLRQKLGRRLAKLENDASFSQMTVKATHRDLVQSLKNYFEVTLNSTGYFLREQWRRHRLSCETFLPALRARAYDHEYRLPLANGGNKLREKMAISLMRLEDQTASPSVFLKQYEKSMVTAKPYMKALELHIATSRYCETVLMPAKNRALSVDAYNTDLSEVICDCVSRLAVVDPDYPNQRSQMFLHLLEMWILLDKHMVAVFPLLKDYHPGFDPDILDPVQLLTAADMQRAQDVRAYLAKRYRSRAGMSCKTIFDDPADDCFAVQYYDCFDIDDKLLEMRELIEEKAEEDYNAKVEEWQSKSEHHEQIIRERNETECIYDTSINMDGTTMHRHHKPCSWHDLHNEARDLKIQIFEEPLPNYEPAAKAVIFELLCPKDFAAYRDATWKILCNVCLPPSDPPEWVSLIKDYSQLQRHANAIERVVTLGSPTKAHLEAHYAISGFPIRSEDVLRNCGLRPKYYDRSGNAWTGSRGKPSLWHHFPLRLPPDSPFLSLGLKYVEWPSSNEIQASQVNCPEGISAHEFTAWQGLLVGTHSRWLDLLRELGSTNINFSSTSTCVAVMRLVLQHGPDSSSDGHYSDVHSALLDDSLIMKLLGQLRYRLEAIQRNWREAVQMELLITVLLKVVALAPETSVREATGLLEYARQITSDWRTELHMIVTEDPKLYQSAIWASMLCKRTMHLEKLQFTPQSLRHFIDASIFLQYNLTGRFEFMPHQVRNALVQDTVFVYEIREKIKQAILSDTQPLISAIDALWQLPKEHEVRTNHIPETWWIVLELVSTTEDSSHYLHYNYVYGNLLINGKEMGTLPLGIRTHKDYVRLFGHRNPTVFPSHLQGMQFTLSETIKNGHRVHFGYRHGSLVVRVFHNNRLLEYVTPETFGTNTVSPDLPQPLIDDCFHWLNVQDGSVEARRKDAWASKPGNWWLLWRLSGLQSTSGHYRAVRRHGHAGEATLLAPTSELAQNVAHIFRYFEQPSQIMVHALTNNSKYRTGQVVADLKRLELVFSVNREGLLQSQRLGAIVIQNQDAGTWYGLRSKIVIQSTANCRQKSVLIPMGTMKVKKNFEHVTVDIENETGVFLKFGLNDTLRRVECPPEPKLLYTRALLHAYTSHFMPDQLTGCTGTEEALYLLQTGSHQPWKPLSTYEIATLHRLAQLSPERGYYPKEIKCMETVMWRAELTVYMQDDRYLDVVAKILQRSSHLSKFSQDRPPLPSNSLPRSDSHLASRALSLANISKSNLKADVYRSRDARSAGLNRENVLGVTKQLLTWQPLKVDETTLSSLLHGSHFIGGYDKCFRKILLSDHLGVDIKAEWGALARKALECNDSDRFRLIYLFGTMAFSDNANISLIHMLISFAIIPDLRNLNPPQHPGYHHFRDDGAPPSSYLVSLMEKARMPFLEIGFKKRSQLVIAQGLHGPSVEMSCNLLADSIREQWPRLEIDESRLIAVDSKYLDATEALVHVEPEWTRLTRNHELALYIEKVQEILWRYAVTEQRSADCIKTDVSGIVAAVPSLIYPVRDKRRDNLSISDLFQHNSQDCVSSELPFIQGQSSDSYTSILVARSGNMPRPTVGQADNYSTRSMNKNAAKKSKLLVSTPPEISKLRTIAASFKDPTSFVQCRYAKELGTSIDALEHYLKTRSHDVHNAYPHLVSIEINAARDHAMAMTRHVQANLMIGYPQVKWLQMVDMWPRTTTVELLSQLRITSKSSIGKGIKGSLIALGLAITRWQRLLRLQDAQKRGQKQQEREEWSNEGHTNWDPMDYPDWLLLEIDGDHLLREEQVQVALATICPASGENSVLQLLMGKGKTSCILPMVAAILANGDNLMRIVVPRALLLQSAQVLQAKLGGLADRDIIHIPFSRKTPTDNKLMRLYGNMQVSLRDRCGVMLALPEHILSFKLSGLQQLCDNRLEQASTMINIQDWLDSHARDVLDECDVSLAIKTQLIFPSGTQNTVDGHPIRWQVTQSLLHLVKDHILAVQSRFPRSIEIVKRGVDGFPLVYFLRKDAEDYLLHLLITIICRGQTPAIIPCAEYPSVIQESLRLYISSPSVAIPVVSRVTSFLQDKRGLMRTVNLLRGLFVHRILIATLKKRWNVQYGLHPTRAPVAVPYLAKGVASPTAEWGHPDVAILLTCLSFYYQGVTHPQFKQAFEHLIKTDEPNVEYQKWFPKGSDVSNELEDFAAINAEDARQLQDLYQTVRSNAFLVDFYLNNFVFPKYAKTFKLKLQASSWNLFPSISVQDQTCRITGFSGTNDSRHQLPMLIQQSDLPQLAHTNAEVPYYLLAPRNSSYVRMSDPVSGKRWTELELLGRLAKPFLYTQCDGSQPGKIRILIDAGAQILEHSNQEFAKVWLEKDTDAVAAVYFDDEHRAWALYRSGLKCVPLLASPFADNLELCVVYLDEAHCRGTDLKLPINARAALTLGQSLTKDAMVQASMRLRLLGQTQSITFFSPLEVHQGILDRLQESQNYQPHSGDVLRWVFSQTCDAIEQLEPSFFAQTSQYIQQEHARSENPGYLQDPQARDTFLEAVRSKESLSLKQLYEPKRRRGPDSTPPKLTSSLQRIATELQRRKAHFQDRGSAVHASALEEVEVEQEREAEREVEIEVENVREVQQAIRLAALKPKKLHEDIIHFATYGRLVPGSDAYHPMFAVLGRTALGLKHGVNTSMKSKLWVSVQFTQTVEMHTPTDNYLRAPNWILWSSTSQNALVVSPEEANELIPSLRDAKAMGSDLNIHLITYSAPVTRRMLHFNRLDYHAVPPLPPGFVAPVWLTVELGIFAGRLYLDWCEYYELLGYLGFDRDLSVDQERQAFVKKPLTFLREWLALRRKGQDFEHTPMGFVTGGKPLTENHPFFRSRGVDPDIRHQVARHISARTDEAVDDDDDGDQDDEDFVPAEDHFDESEGEDEKEEANVADLDETDVFLDAFEKTE